MIFRCHQLFSPAREFLPPIAQRRTLTRCGLPLQLTSRSWLVKLEAKYSWDIPLWWLLWLQVWICHQKEVRKCCAKVSSVKIYVMSRKSHQRIYREVSYCSRITIKISPSHYLSLPRHIWLWYFYPDHYQLPSYKCNALLCSMKCLWNKQTQFFFNKLRK